MLLDLVRTEDNTDDNRVFMIRNAYENPIFPIILTERLALSAAGVARRTGAGVGVSIMRTSWARPYVRLAGVAGVTSTRG
jgi:hypothetical protein